ncbi:hypothetical protein IE53DRAFT_384180 [Violaceomyces palustris]|uniref:Uncharacterized protein n=1 Tax=Violaceomyces palustris TaxID=1673888 RepID=A0ACD0P5P4_9BASI|nr:hypothetical protein IE53DRAFT_384180 [Violaceomyces palustris]
MQSTRSLTSTSRLLAQTFRLQPSALPLVARSSPACYASSRQFTNQSSSQKAPVAPVSKMSQAENLDLLNKQRSLRPSSPHFTIYQPQLTWLGSIANRVTGVGLSVGMYAYAIAYLAGPHIGLGEFFASSHLVGLAATAPFWLKVALKAPLAAAFSYHTFNGIRHLLWDAGKCLTLKGAYTSGYIVIGATALSTIGLVLL